VPKVSKRTTQRIEQLLASAEESLGFSFCYHDFIARSGICRRWSFHTNPACLVGKNSGDGICDAYGGHTVHEDALGHVDGYLHTCPRGYTEIASPVFSAHEYIGVVFGGTCWLGRGRPPHTGLIVPPSRKWLQARVPLVKAVATELGTLLAAGEELLPEDRRSRIRSFLREKVARPVRLDDLARALWLSSSRTAHAVKEEFGVSFSALVRSMKVQEAARLLVMTRLSVTQVAQQVGYDDPNYFSRVFSSELGVPPRVYRKRNAAQV